MIFNPLETAEVRMKRERTDKVLIGVAVLVLIVGFLVVGYIRLNPVILGL